MLPKAKRLPIEISDDLTAQIEDLALKTGRSNAEVVQDAVQHYLINQARWRRDMDTALLDTETGTGYDGDEVLDWMESWATGDEKPRPQLTTAKP